MDDLFSRKKRRSPFLLLGSIAFGLLALSSFFDAARDPPLVFLNEEVLSIAERLGYRIGAGLLCTLLAALTYPRAEPSERS